MDEVLWPDQTPFPSTAGLLAPLLHVAWPISHGHARTSFAEACLHDAFAAEPTFFATGLDVADLVAGRGAVFHALAHPHRPHAPVGRLQDRLVGLALGPVFRRVGALPRLVPALRLSAAR